MPRKSIAVWLLLLVALALGALIGWVDSRPGWDDTGITVGLIVLATGLLGLAQPSAAWLWALAVGAWVPVIEIPAAGNPAALLALVVAFICAFGGALVRKAFDALRTSSTHPQT